MTTKSRTLPPLPDSPEREPDEYTHETRDTLRLYPSWVIWVVAVAACVCGVFLLLGVIQLLGGMIWFTVFIAFCLFALAKHVVRQTRIR